jgi:hypothetical protein
MAIPQARRADAKVFAPRHTPCDWVVTHATPFLQACHAPPRETVRPAAGLGPAPPSKSARSLRGARLHSSSARSSIAKKAIVSPRLAKEVDEDGLLAAPIIIASNCATSR